ncbi:sigma-54-dependent Fis family transcriptional regulator [candidate division KSB1 bacterium]|nr:sigma-54-dependent Fis family transcriptional regulator [candidate division KSB1 bacterium]MBL7095162.1 sigma-54-dependent Fis family transcriptional regulator [candidate division KSB1 bacterium]
MNKQKKSLILIVDDDQKTLDIVEDILTKNSYKVLTAQNGEEAIQLFETNPIELVLLDYDLPGSAIQGIETLEQMTLINSLIPVLIISGVGGVPGAVKSLQVGAVDYIEKPLNMYQLLARINEQLEKGSKLQAKEKAKNDLYDKYGMIGTANGMLKIYEQIDQVAPTNAKVLIMGESGVGKELVANAIHSLSHRGNEPFIKINCAAIPSELIESELFGHRKGIFTGAFTDKIGKFQIADKGTIFLDEIGDMSLMTQAKVLRAIEGGDITPLGETKEIKIDVRVVAATNKNLEKEVNLGKFREDLYYRLNVVTIEVPPLDERKDDLPYLAEYFLKTFCDQYNKKHKHITNRAMECLINQDWKGNVRELRNLMEKLVIFVTEEIIDLKHLKEIFGRQRMSEKLELNLPLKQARDQFEKEYIETKLIANGWQIGVTADQLGMERTNLYRKMKQLGIEQVKLNH